MRLDELWPASGQSGAYSPENDTFQMRKLFDTRKPELTLKLLNRLKLIRALRKFEELKRRDLLAAMYGHDDPAEEALRLDNEKTRLNIEKARIGLRTEMKNVPSGDAGR